MYSRNNALGTIGFGTALLFSLLVPDHGNTAPVNFQFNGSLNDVDDSAFTPGATGTNRYVTALTSPGSFTFVPSTRGNKPSENIGRYNPTIPSRTGGGG